jgi:nitric oxide synthase oxygenase domain/subunit
VQRQTEFARQDAVARLFDAIEMARLKSDSLSMVRAVTELNRMHGYHARGVKHVAFEFDVDKFRQRLEQMSDGELSTLSEGEGSRRADP